MHNIVRRGCFSRKCKRIPARFYCKILSLPSFVQTLFTIWLYNIYNNVCFGKDTFFHESKAASYQHPHPRRIARRHRFGDCHSHSDRHACPCVLPGIRSWRSPALPRKKKGKKSPEQKRAEKKAAKEEKAHLAKLKRAGVKLPPEPLPTLVPPLCRERTIPLRAVDWLCAASFLAAAIIDARLIPTLRLRVVFALISALAYVLPMNGHKLSPLARLGHLASCAYCIVCIATDYFDWNAPMNGPAKVSTQLTLCIVILYLSANARLAIADHILRRRNVCAALAAIAGVSMGIANLCAIPTGAMLDITVSPMLICSAVGIHAAVSLIPTFIQEVPTLIVPPKRPLPPLDTKNDAATAPERQDPA